MGAAPGGRADHKPNRRPLKALRMFSGALRKLWAPCGERLILDRFVCNAPEMRETLPDRSASSTEGELPDPTALSGAPMSLDELVRAGGVNGLAGEAARQAIDRERRFWLPVLEAWLEQYVGRGIDGAADLYALAYLTGEIRRLRRLTGISLSLEQRRAKTRDRVRRWRERQKDIDPKPARR